MLVLALLLALQTPPPADGAAASHGPRVAELVTQLELGGLPHPPEAGRGASAWIAFADGARVVPVP